MVRDKHYKKDIWFIILALVIICYVLTVMELVDKINYLLSLKVFLMVVALSINNKTRDEG
ncbi:MAG TPA: hypothetical protein DCG60_04195 [Tissierella sp.]|uniref:hypothetical protein n=1 Tax=Tissierella praeacuta TaxID=43131 RepID=UPI000EBBD917|nr:hypothetical protein [Tissierella praeacuta]HAE91833.1 hypothetical protein [Tissierella sp.]